MNWTSHVAVLAVAGSLLGCAQESSRNPSPQYPANRPGVGPYPTQTGPWAQYPPIGQPQSGTAPAGAYPAPASTQTTTPSTSGTLPAPAFGSFDASGSMTPAFIRMEAKVVLDELVAALPDQSKSRVVGIPLVVIEDPAEVNAFAGCDQFGRAFMGITAPLLTIESSGSEAKAFDELYGTNRYDQYAAETASRVRAGQPPSGLAPGSLPLPQAVDPRKLSRQSFLLDEQLAFVLGHELAHHYRGHTGCANGVSGGVGGEDVARLLSGAVPLFNQPVEIEADMYGVTNLLDTGARRQNGRWTEEGAMMTLQFFARLSSLGVETVFLGFLRTHPPPQLRIPIVQNTAQNWHRQRASGGTGTPSPFPLPFPFPFQLPK